MTKFAVFDIDGTIFRWQLYHALFDEFAEQGIIPPQRASEVHQKRQAWQRRNTSFHDYEQALVHAMNASIIGTPIAALIQAADRIIERDGANVYTYTRDLARSLQKKGYTLIALSASQQELVERFGALYGFDICRGVRYESSDGVVSDIGRTIYDKKGIVLQEIAQEYNLSWDNSYAVGDSGSDAAMLELVAHPIAFNPDKNLLETAKKRGWTVVVERKNVIYTLQKESDDRFVLA